MLEAHALPIIGAANVYDDHALQIIGAANVSDNHSLTVLYWGGPSRPCRPASGRPCVVSIASGRPCVVSIIAGKDGWKDVQVYVTLF